MRLLCPARLLVVIIFAFTANPLCQARGYTAGIISLLTHICICVVLNILVHAQLTYGHQSRCH